MKYKTKKKRWQQLTALMLCMLLAFTSMPAVAFAESTETVSSAETVQPATGPDGTETTADGESGDSQPAAEIEALREETVKHFLNEDGSFTAVNYMVPVHYQEEGSDAWKEIDNTLSALETSVDGETVTKYIPQDSPIDVQITDSADSGQLVSLQGETHKITWSYEDLKASKAERKAKPQKAGKDRKTGKYMPDGLTDGLVYEDIADSTDLEIVLDGVNLKENLLLKDKHAQTQYVIRYDIGSLVAEEQDEHTVLLKDDDGTVFTIHAPYMTDAAGAASDAVSLHIFSQSEGILRVVLTADKKWVKDKERVYPVTVDPFVLEQMKSANYDATAFENIQGDAYPYGTLSAGNDGDYATGDGKFYVKFTLPELKAGDMVTGGELYLRQFDGTYGYDNSGADSLQLNAYRVSESWTASGIINQAYSGAPSVYSSVVDYMNVSAVDEKTWRNFDISRSVKDWYGGASNYGICVKADSSSPQAMARFIAADNGTYTGYRPFITVRYLNNKGLESRWTYHEQSFGESGTGYVNDYTGNLVLSVPLAETSGELMPASLSLVYNGYQGGKKVDQVTTAGKGWRLNIQQRVVELESSNSASSDDDVNDLYDALYETGYRYVYEDADGTDHYFRAKEGSSSKFIDEEGLGLTLTEVSTNDSMEEWKIAAEDGSSLTFTPGGYLRKAYDSDGNSFCVRYTTTTSGLISSVEDGAGRKITLARDGDNDNRVTKVTDPADRDVTLSYTSGGSLSSITYPDGTACAFAYSGGKVIRVLARDDTRIRYTYADGDAAEKNRVVKVEEFGKGATSACEDDYLGQSLDITYGKNRSTFTASDGLKQVYQFDNYGRTVSVSDPEGGSRCFSYLNPSSSDVDQRSERSHLVSSTGSSSEFVENQLSNHSLEGGSSGWSMSSAELAEGTAFLGSNSIRLYDAAGAASQKYTPSSASKFTFSAYVKTDSSAVHPKLRVNFYDAEGTRLSYVDTPVRKTKLNWSRMHLAFTVPDGASYFRVTCKMEGEGSAWFDCMQLETGHVMNPYNLVENSDFDETITGTWTEVNTVSADKRITTDSGAGSYYLTGEGDTKKRLYQKIPVGRSAKNLCFSVSGKGEGTSVPFTSDDRRFALQIYTGFTDDTYILKTIRFNPDYTGSQYTSGIVRYSGDNAGKMVEYISVRCIYNCNENAAEFDRIQVNLDETGTSYTYDDEGNLISASDNAGRNQAYTYSTAGEILRAESADNKNYAYTYSDSNKHRLKTATSESSDIRFTFGYNSTGGNTTVTVQAVDSSGNTEGKYIRQTTSYTEDGNYIDVRYNTRGKDWTYTWNEEKGLVTGEEDPAGNVTDYTYSASDDYLTKVTKDGTSISYSYTTENLLKKITSPSTVYSFSHDAFGNVLTTAIGSRTLNTNAYASNNGNLASSTYGNGFKTGYTYDDYDRITRISRGDSTAFRWTYNASGQVGRHEDVVNDRTYQYTYDLAGRLLRTDISDGSYIRTAYNDISLPTVLHYRIADEGARSVYYTYSLRDNLPESVSFGSSSTKTVTNHYDGLARKDYVEYATPSDDVAEVKAIYGYYDWTSDTERTTDVVNHINYVHTHVSGGLAALDRFYTYGTAGNITAEYNGSSTEGTLKEKYGYDAKGQLVRHYSARQNKTFVYEYDRAGNILKKKTYPYVTTLADLNAIIDSPEDTVSYTYGDSGWGDLLTAYDGKAVTSDAIGNMTGYDGQTWEWEGRQLSKYTDADNLATTYSYNADGVRTKKVTGGVTTEYFLNGEQILWQKTGTGDDAVEVWFFYDSEGNRVGMYGGGCYLYYLYNVQGDVIALADAATGKIAVSYTYDAWGRCLTEKTAAGFEAVSGLNPFKYRGYYWDSESGLYYLNSRYYNPEFGRFISADSQINGDLLGTNLFAYCSNNPVNRTDDQGTFWDTLLDVASTAYSAWQVIKNPKDPANWAALAADVVCLAIPGVTGGGTIVRSATKYGDDIIEAGKNLNRLSDGAGAAYDAGRAVGNGATNPALCFVEGTPVLTEEGLKEIESVREGESVWAEDPETGEKSLKEVVQIFVNETDELVHVYTGDEKISATPEHPFYVRDRGWTGAVDLKVGDVLVLQDGGYVIVEKIQHEILERPVTVYNFEVEGFHTYYVGADSVLVHNMCAMTVSVDDLLSNAVETTSRKGITKNFQSSGGYNQTLRDFNSLGLSNIKTIQTQYGEGLVGSLPTGGKVVARPGSSENFPTLEIMISNTKRYKIRY